MIGRPTGNRGLMLAAALAALAGLGMYQFYGRLAGELPRPGRDARLTDDASGAAPASASRGGLHRGPAGISGGGDASPSSPRADVARPIPEQLPEFVLATAEGPPRALSSFTQPSLIVNFWATWCAPCRREIPLLKKLRAEHGASGVEIVGVAVDFRDDVLKYARDVGIDYPLLIGEQDGLAAAKAFGMDMVFPFTAFADAKRRIVALKVGELHEDEASFILDMVAEVNAGRLELAAARTAIGAKLRLLAAKRAGKAPDPGLDSRE